MLRARKLQTNIEGWLRTAAWAWAVIAFLAFVGFAATIGPPETPENAIFERNLQLVLLGAVALSLGVGLFSEEAGGLLLLVAGVALGVVATVSYHPLRGFTIAAVFLVPAITFIGLFAWRHGLLVRGATIMFVIAVLVSGGVGATRVHAYYFGPAHPNSTLEALPSSPVEWVWAGALTPHSITVNAKVRSVQGVRMALAEEPGFKAARWITPTSSSSADSVASFVIDGLEPGVAYHYAIEVEGELDLVRPGSFTTPIDGPSSFTVAIGSCARTGSNGAVFDAIRESAPLLYLVLGDFHYSNIETNDPERFRSAYDDTLTATSQSALYRTVPLAYVWDDHDFGGNDADSTSPSREAAQEVYREYVPHYPLGDPGGAIYQAFTVGRVRFVMTDTRSAQTDETMLGPVQVEWLKAELLRAHETHALTVWVNGAPWIVESSSGSDDWGGYASERQELANFIAEHDLDRIVMLSGDAHMLAIDDGSNTDYSSSENAGFPLLHAGALDRPGSTKGGPYSEGAFPGAGQFALMDVVDDGSDAVRVVWRGLNWKQEEIVHYETEFRIR